MKTKEALAKLQLEELLNRASKCKTFISQKDSESQDQIKQYSQELTNIRSELDNRHYRQARRFPAPANIQELTQALKDVDKMISEVSGAIQQYDQLDSPAATSPSS